MSNFGFPGKQWRCLGVFLFSELKNHIKYFRKDQQIYNCFYFSAFIIFDSGSNLLHCEDARKNGRKMSVKKYKRMDRQARRLSDTDKACLFFSLISQHSTESREREKEPSINITYADDTIRFSQKSSKTSKMSKLLNEASRRRSFKSNILKTKWKVVVKVTLIQCQLWLNGERIPF